MSPVGARPAPGTAPALVTLTVWGVRGRDLPRVLVRMADDRRRVRAVPGVRFAKLLGTGDGRTFTMRDADLRHWALLACWDDTSGETVHQRLAPVAGRWDAMATERLDVALRPMASRGRWSGRTPFGDPVPVRHDGPVAAITRARIRPAAAAAFWRAVPPVSADLHAGEGALFTLGIGEAPVGLQGTFSIWRDADALTDFAYRRSPHRQAIADTTARRWYTEELFARFAVLSVSGAHGGRAREV